ncbi:MAG: site-specific integrase [Candidatus Bathyarchaeia archaeon]
MTLELKGERQDAGATQLSSDIKGRLVEFAWWLKKQGRSEHTIANYVEFLKMMVENTANILNPESIKDVLARLNKSNSWKHHAICAANAFLKMHGLTWEKPKCVRQRKLPFIPLENELDNLVAGAGKKVAAFLQLLKETGMRAGEALRLNWRDVDFERQIIVLNQPEKGSQPRVFKVSSKLIGMLNALPRKSERIFPITYHAMKRSFMLARKKIAVKLANPRLLQISFHTFRHWKATVEYHRTKDPLYVKELLGHKKLDTTLLYIQIERTIFQDSNDEFTVKTARTPEEIKGLLEVGFEYVCEKDGLMFFRKRK